VEVEAQESAEIIVEVPKSLQTLRSKKDKQAMISMHKSPRQALRTKLTLQEKGKAINLEVNGEEEF